mgnify:CR=1 FL=1
MDNIGLFLHLMKEIVDKNNFILVEREASLEFMAGMGITMDELKNVILSLTATRDTRDGQLPNSRPRHSARRCT